jgi:hypothetical protein
MTDRQTSYWLSVLLAPPVIGLLAGCFWGFWMGLLVGPTFVRWLFPAALFGFWIGGMFMLILAISLRPVRKEWPVIGDSASRNQLVAESKRMRFRIAFEDGNYLRMRPRTLFKPLCSTIEVWLYDQVVVVDGPSGVVNKLMKRLSKSSEQTKEK